MRIKSNILFRFLMITLIALGFDSCITPFDAQTQNFESALVIDALITDELKQHTVKILRAYRFEETEPQVERNASVVVTADNGSNYSFSEASPGHYVSQIAFSAVAGTEYSLQIETSDGRSYESIRVMAPETTPISNLYAERQINDEGVEGISIRLDNETTTADPTYFRYEFEETYKIIAPDYSPFVVDIIDDIPCADGDAYEVDIKPRAEEARICYASAKSNAIMQAATIDLDDNRISRYLVRFLNRANYIISHRYSIMVRQFRQNQDAYSYYQSLEDFNSSESIFSETQPGFLFGNIASTQNSNEKVLGFFEVASVSSQRLYLNYEDFFPGEPLPPYAEPCDFIDNPLLLIPDAFHCDGPVCDGNCASPLIDGIRDGIFQYIAENEEFDFTDFNIGPYFTKASACVDCTTLGSTIIPDFWIE